MTIIPPVQNENEVPEGARCQEASIFSKEKYIPCSAPAEAVVHHPSEGRSYYMCWPCADHNVRHRGAQLKHRAERPQPVSGPPSGIRTGGKYAGVVGALPQYVSDDAKYQDLVNKEKAEVTDRSASALAQLIVDKRVEKAGIQAEMDKVNLRLEALYQLLADAYEQEGVSSVTLGAGGSVSTQLEPVPRVEDREAFRLWCVQEGMERSMFLHPSTAAALVKERLLAGEDLPPGVQAWVRVKVVVRGVPALAEKK